MPMTEEDACSHEKPKEDEPHNRVNPEIGLNFRNGLEELITF